MNTTAPSRPVVLCILDGWGERDDPRDNAVAQANTPVWDRFVRDNIRTRLNASAEQVGLPAGQMGNSEVGHMNLGAGRVVEQDLPRIDHAIADGSLANNPHLTTFTDALKASGGACHLLGLLSPGGVHSMQGHMAALARAVCAAGVRVVVHGFLDGRDTAPNSARDFTKDFAAQINDLDSCTFGTISGRFYAMDRDNRWDRVEKACAALVDAKGETAKTADQAIGQSYANETFDEFVLPTVIGDYSGMRDGDGLLMANFRADRAREILHALIDPAFDGFARSRTVAFAAQLGMVEYSNDLNAFLPALFPPIVLNNILGQVVANAGKTQLRVAETEKYAHVTFFFNGGEETVFPGEERILISSPKVATYDLQPAMSADQLTDSLLGAIGDNRFDLIIVNYANGDMVGHTGMLNAAIEATQTVDACLGRLERAVIDAGGTMLVTADHGNCEMMRDPQTGGVHTAHTLNPVPLVLVNPPRWVNGLREGRLADVAPTLLKLLGLDQPVEMTGGVLLVEEDRRAST